MKNHRAKTFTISSTDRHKRVVDRQKANILVVELVDLAKFEDLEIDLTNKKVYQLIDDANKIDYYYNQAKDQRF